MGIHLLGPLVMTIVSLCALCCFLMIFLFLITFNITLLEWCYVNYLRLCISILPLGRFLASRFSILSCFPPFSLIPHTMILSNTYLAYPIVFFPLVFFLSSNPLSHPLAGFHL